MVPVHKALPSRNSRMRSPTATKHDIMLAVKEICRVGRVKSHWLEPSMLLQHSASPLPNTAQIALARELVAIRGHRNWMPVFEAHIRALKVDEERGRGWISSVAGGAVEVIVGWWSFFDTVVDEMAIADESAIQPWSR